MSEKKKIFSWNHISEKLNENEIEELKSYYITYHRKCGLSNKQQNVLKN